MSQTGNLAARRAVGRDGGHFGAVESLEAKSEFVAREGVGSSPICDFSDSFSEMPFPTVQMASSFIASRLPITGLCVPLRLRSSAKYHYCNLNVSNNVDERRIEDFLGRVCPTRIEDARSFSSSRIPSAEQYGVTSV
jgi:hypothetical protein